MNEAIQKFKEMLKASQTIAVDCGTSDDTQKILSAALLHHAFLSLGKKSRLCFRASDAQKDKIRAFIEELLGSAPEAAPEENLVIKFDSRAMPLSELKYEKDGDMLKIILAGNSAIGPSDLVIEKEKLPVDLLMLVDPNRPEIDSLIVETPHRDVIKISSKERALALKAAEIVVSILDNPSEQIRTAAWYLLDREDRLCAAPSKEILLIKEGLLNAPVSADRAHKARAALLGSSFWKLFGRMLARCEFEKQLKTIWAFLPHSDFQKTGLAENTIHSLFLELQMLRQEGSFFALLWEQQNKNGNNPINNQKTINAIVGAKNFSAAESLASLLGAATSSNYFFVRGFKTFSEAELKIRSALQRIL